MSFETELTRVAEGAKGTLKSLITKLGGTVADEKIDGYPELAEAIEVEDIGIEEVEFEEGQPKITASGILKGDGEGNITAAVAGEDYLDASYTPTVVKETNQGLDQKFWRGTKEEFDAVETKSDDTMYIVTDEEGAAVASAAVQSDWAQNDETADDYIKNRFGGYYGDVETTCIEEATFEFSVQDDGLYYSRIFYSNSLNVPQLDINDAKSVRIVVDGVSYTLTESDSWMTWVYEADGILVELHGFINGVDGEFMYLDLYTSLEGVTHTVVVYMTHNTPISIPFEFIDQELPSYQRSQARSNLGAASVDDVDSIKTYAYLATLAADGWDADALAQTVSVPGILADESKQLIIPMPTIASMTAYNDAGIQVTYQKDNALVFAAQEMPTEDIQVYVSFQNVTLVTG